MTALPPGVEALTPPTASAFDCVTEQERGAFFEWFDYAFDTQADEMALHAFAAGMRAAHAQGARAGYLAGLEAAAKVCDTVPVCNLLGTSLGYEQGKEMAVMQCKSAIRSIGEKK